MPDGWNRLTQLSMVQSGKKNGLLLTYAVGNIEWDTDGEDIEDLDLPESIVLSVALEKGDDRDVAEDYISDYLSDTFGYCHFGFSLEEIDRDHFTYTNTRKTFGVID